MKKNCIILLLAFLCLSIPSGAQFYVGGNERSSIRWMSVTGPDFKLIYPCGMDSLANLYLQELEHFRPIVATGVGMASGQFQKKPLQVLLHTQNPSSNGSVTWTPSRMELLTIPQWSNPSAMPWITSLVVHEGRHAAQMQNGYRRVFRPFGYILGQIIPAFAAAYPGKLLLEGDAVVAETALTRSGRGRSGDFLNYYMYAAGRGDRRNYIRWREGSYYNYTPDHYAYGYMLLSGMHYRYACPDFMAQYFDYVSRRPYDPWPLRHNMRRVSGTHFRTTLTEIMDTHYKMWASDTASRTPFISGNHLSVQPRHLREYDAQGGGTWIKKDIYGTPVLVSIDSCGKDHRLLNVPGHVVRVNYCGLDSSLVWNEIHRHPRWSEVGTSVIRKYHIPSGKVETLARDGNYIYPVEYGRDTLCAIKYMQDGSSVIALLDGRGRQLDCIPVPSGLQAVQLAVSGGNIYSAAISEGGFGIWKVGSLSNPDCGRWTEVLPPAPVQMASLAARGSELTFSSDRNGVWEFYTFNLASGELRQRSSSLYGGNSFNLCEDGALFYSKYCEKGSCAYKIPADSLLNKKVEWSEYYHYPIADSLSRQASALASAMPAAQPREEAGSRNGRDVTESRDGRDVTPQPSRYPKFANAFRFHSWAPAYIDMDALENMSFENVKKMASLGAMAFFQNTLSTFYGHVGYKAAKQGGKWAHSGHMNLTYSGLYPVFEGEVHFNTRQSCEYFRKSADNDTIFVRETGKPYINTSLRAYVPWQWNDGVLQWGVIPSAKLLYSNDIYLGSTMLKFAADLRTYVMRNIPQAGVYPFLGIGAQVGWADPLTYANIWSYLPGIVAGQGLKLSATGQWLTGDIASPLSTYVLILPRGLQNFDRYSRAYTGFKFSADYAVPFYMGDWHILDMFYCTRGIVTPHLDVSVIGNGTLASAGAAFEMEFGSFFWIRTPVTVGVMYSYNFGSAFPSLGLPSPHYVGATFNISLPN